MQSPTFPGMNEEDFTPADFIINHKEYQNDVVIKLYDDWTNYEQEMLDEGYVGHIETVNLVAKHVPTAEREYARIIDIGAGTGLVGIELKKHGFSNVDALDPCNILLQKAKERNIYENYYSESLSPRKPCSTPNDVYDHVTAVGCFAGTHIPPELLVEVLRILKPGGLAFVTVRDLPENLGLVDVGEELQGRGQLEILQTYKFPRFRKGIRGICYIYKKK